MIQRFLRNVHIVYVTMTIVCKYFTDLILSSPQRTVFLQTSMSKARSVCYLISFGEKSLSLDEGLEVQPERGKAANPSLPQGSMKGWVWKREVLHIFQFLPWELHISRGKPKRKGVPSTKSVSESVKRLPGGLLAMVLNLEAKMFRGRSTPIPGGVGGKCGPVVSSALLGRFRRPLSGRPES